MRQCVLLVAAELELRARFARELQASGYTVELASDEKRALRLALDNTYQGAILAPGPSPASLQLMQELRDAVPIMIVLVEGSADIDRLRRSLPTVDELLPTSLSDGTLTARLGELLRRTDSTADESGPAPGTLWIEDNRLDLTGYVFVDAAGREVALTRAETNFLKELAAVPCQVVSRDKLRRAVAGRDADPFDRSVDMLVARLRRKIEPEPKAPRFLVTVPGIGYKLVARPQSADVGQSGHKPYEAERRQVTALSCRLVGSVALAVSLDPEDLVEITQTFQDAAVQAITGMGGTIATVAPDEILAFFGYPQAHEDDADRAVNAALEAVTKIRRLVSPKGDPLQAQVALATGLAFASARQTLGRPSVLAQAISDLAPPNSVLATASTRRLLSAAFVCENPERYALPGLSDPISACRVTGRRAVANHFKAKHSNKVTRLVDRKQELQQLFELWNRAKRGQGQVVLVCGEPGIGKSHLCEFFLEHVIEDPHATLRYQCSPFHLNNAFYPLIRQLEHAMGFEQTDSPEAKLQKLEAALSQAVTVTQEDISLYASLLSIAAPALEPSLSPHRQKDLTVAALSRHLLELANKGPLIVQLADTHWIDSSSLELVNRIIPLIKGAPVLLLITFRPEFIPQWLGEPHLTLLRLERMGREESLAMIAQVSDNTKLPERIEQQIVQRAEGVPLFIEELTKAILESEPVHDGGDRNIAADSIQHLAIPATLLDSLTARLDRLGPAKEIAQIAAVIGREFSLPLLTAVAPPSADSLQAALTRLVAAELVSVSGEFPDVTYTFKHALVRDAAYGTLTRRKRQRLHSRIADALESAFPFTVETEPELLAHHLAEAGIIDRAVDYLQRAGRRSIERSANADAIKYLTRALELLQSRPDLPQRKCARFSLEVMLAQAMTATYGYAAPRLRETLLRAKGLINDSTDPIQKFAVLYGIWASYYVAGETAKQKDAAVEFLLEAERINDSASLCIAHRLVGTTYLTMGEFVAGLRHLKQARTLYIEEHHAAYRHQWGQDIGAAALCYLSSVLWHLGYVDQAAEAATEAMKLAERLSHPHTLIYTICHVRGLMDLFRRHEAGKELYAGLVVSICNENGFSHWANFGRILDGWTSIRAGEVDRGMEVLQEGVGEWQKAGARLWLPMFLILEADTYAKSGRDEVALQTIERALNLCEETGERWAVAEVLRKKAAILQSTGRATYQEVEAILLKSLEIARHQQALSWQLRTSCDLARLWQRRRRAQAGLKLLESVYHQFTEGFDAPDLQDARKLLQNLRRNLRDGGGRRRVRRVKSERVIEAAVNMRQRAPR
jgi:DNA-binding response OmpR family regulator/class 3 adenylate cyclase/predicted ATPase